MPAEPLDAQSPSSAGQLDLQSHGLLDEQGRIAAGVPCVECGYDLRMLSVSTRCPECGHPTRSAIESFFLCRTAPRWVHALSVGAWLFALGLLLPLVGVPLALSAQHILLALLKDEYETLLEKSLHLAVLTCVLGGGVLAALGVFRLTAREPHARHRPHMHRLRRVLRGCVLLFVFSMILIVLANIFSRIVFGLLWFADTVFILLCAVAVLTGLGTLPLLARHLEHLCHRAQELPSVRRAKWLFWALLVGAALIVVGLAEPVLEELSPFSTLPTSAGAMSDTVTPVCFMLGFPVEVIAGIFLLLLILDCRRVLKRDARLAAEFARDGVADAPAGQ